MANFGGLSLREKEVLRLSSYGMKDTDIAIALGITCQTVKNHKLSARKRLGVKSTTHAVALCIRKGILNGN